MCIFLGLTAEPLSDNTPPYYSSGILYFPSECKSLAVDATASWRYRIWAITLCSAACFSASSKGSQPKFNHKHAHPPEKNTRFESPSCRFKPGHKTENAFRATFSCQQAENQLFYEMHWHVFLLPGFIFFPQGLKTILVSTRSTCCSTLSALKYHLLSKKHQWETNTTKPFPWLNGQISLWS